MGNLGCRGFLRGWLFLSGTFSCGCPSGATGVPLFTIWDSVAVPGRTPMPGNNSGLSHPGNSAVPSTVVRLGVDGFWVRDYGGGSG